MAQKAQNDRIEKVIVSPEASHEKNKVEISPEAYEAQAPVALQEVAQKARREQASFERLMDSDLMRRNLNDTEVLQLGILKKKEQGLWSNFTARMKKISENLLDALNGREKRRSEPVPPAKNTLPKIDPAAQRAKLEAGLQRLSKEYNLDLPVINHALKEEREAEVAALEEINRRSGIEKKQFIAVSPAEIKKTGIATHTKPHPQTIDFAKSKKYKPSVVEEYAKHQALRREKEKLTSPRSKVIKSTAKPESAFSTEEQKSLDAEIKNLSLEQAKKYTAEQKQALRGLIERRATQVLQNEELEKTLDYSPEQIELLYPFLDRAKLTPDETEALAFWEAHQKLQSDTSRYEAYLARAADVENPVNDADLEDITPETHEIADVKIGMATEASLEHPDRNEDSSFEDREKQVFGLADGLGGYSDGAIASRILTKILSEKTKAPNSLLSKNETLDQAELAGVVKEMEDAFLDAHREIKNYALTHDIASMGTTGLALKINGKHLVAASYGDSGLLSFNPATGSVEWALKPASAIDYAVHNLKPEMLRELGLSDALIKDLEWIIDNAHDAKKLTYANGRPVTPQDKKFLLEVVFYPGTSDYAETISKNIRPILKMFKRNTTAKAIAGHSDAPERENIDHVTRELAPGEILIPSSDGLTDALSLPQIAEFLRNNPTLSPEQLAQGLKDMAQNIYHDALTHFTTLERNSKPGTSPAELLKAYLQQKHTDRSDTFRTSDKFADDITVQVIKTTLKKIQSKPQPTKKSKKPPRLPISRVA